jgi:hypothetical protein
MHTFLTPALDKGVCPASRPDRFTSGKIVPSTHVYEAGWTPEPGWTLLGRTKSVPLKGIESGLKSRSACSLVTILPDDNIKMDV